MTFGGISLSMSGPTTEMSIPDGMTYMPTASKSGASANAKMPKAIAAIIPTTDDLMSIFIVSARERPIAIMRGNAGMLVAELGSCLADYGNRLFPSPVKRDYRNVGICRLTFRDHILRREKPNVRLHLPVSRKMRVEWRLEAWRWKKRNLSARTWSVCVGECRPAMSRAIIGDCALRDVREVVL